MQLYIHLYDRLIEMTTELIGMGECSSPKPGDSCHNLWLTYFIWHIGYLMIRVT